MTKTDLTCWFCQQTQSKDGYTVELVNHNQRAQVVVPVCSDCKNKHTISIKRFFLVFYGIACSGFLAHVAVLFFRESAPVGSGVLLGYGMALIWIIPALILGILAMLSSLKGTKPQRYLLQYPALQARLKEGYSIGKSKS